MKTLREKIEALPRSYLGISPLNERTHIRLDSVLRIVAEHEQAQAPVLDLTPGGPVKGGDRLAGSPVRRNVTAPPVGQAGGDEVTEARERLADIKRQMKALGDDRGWQWDSLDGLREEAQADYDHAVGMQLLEVEQMACDADEGAK